MASVDALRFRTASRTDARAVAVLHADSWRMHYRGAFADDYLDGDLEAERLAMWTERLAQPDGRTQTILAEDGEDLVGFGHTIFELGRWGALLDNLHVANGVKRRGVGSRLLSWTARAALERGTRFHLWVLEQNLDARAFYEARGGERVERAPVPPPGGIAGRLNGSPFGLRYAWADPAVALF